MKTQLGNNINSVLSNKNATSIDQGNNDRMNKLAEKLTKISVRYFFKLVRY
jgi:hypothetical protein